MMDYITVTDTVVALQVKGELEKRGLRDPNFNPMDYNKFTKQELSSIQSLSLGSFKDLSMLQYMTNLKQLSIKQEKVNELRVTSSQHQIKDYSPISKLKSLEYLSIENQEGIETLDLSELENLEELELIRNSNLKQVRGIDKLKKLSTLKLLKNNISEAFDLPSLIEQNFCDVSIDVDLYPALRKKYPDLPEIISEKSKQGQRCYWIENVSDFTENRLSTPLVEKMNNKVQDILNDIVGKDYSDIEKITAIYEYITENVKYDHEGLEADKDEKLRREYSKKISKGVLTETTEDTLKRIQSGYNAIMENRSVCEGYTNMMHYILKSVGIESVTCSCDAKSGQIAGRSLNHAVLRANVGNDWFSFDPTWDAGKKDFRHFMKTKEEFNLTHSLSVSEENIESPEIKKYSDAELKYVRQKVQHDRASGKNRRTNAEQKKTTSFEDMTKGMQSTNEEFYDYVRSQKEKIGEDIDRGLFGEDNSKKKDDKVEKTDGDYIW